MTNHFETLLAGLSAEDRREISSIPDRFVDRALEDDWHGVAELYHPDAIQLPPDQPAVKGVEAIRHALSRLMGSEGGVKLEEFVLSIREAAGIGDLVYVRATYRIRMSVTVDKELINIEQHGPYINILRQDGEGRWRIYRQIYNRDHPPSMP